MPTEDPRVAEAGRAGGKDVLLALGRGHLRAHDPRVRDPGHEGHGHVDADRARAQREDERDEEHVERERLHDVHRAHDRRLGRAPVVAGQEPQRRADDERDDDRGEADEEVDAGAVEQPRPDVPSELVGAQEVLG